MLIELVGGILDQCRALELFGGGETRQGVSSLCAGATACPPARPSA